MFRDFFCDTILRFDDGDNGMRYKRLLFACSNPQWVAFLDVVCDADLGEAEQAVVLHNGGQSWEHMFTILPEFFTFTHLTEGEFFPDTEISVLTNVVYACGYRLGSDADWRPWVAIVAMLGPMNGPGAGEARHNSDHRPTRNFLTEHPWLLDVYGESRSRPSSSSGRQAAGDVEGEAWVEEEDVDPEAVIEALAMARALWEDKQDATDVVHFAWSIRGGAWTAAHRGAAYDSFRSQAVTDRGKDFLRRHGLHQSATFSLASYGEGASSVMARYWVARMAFLFSLEEASVPGKLVFTDAAVGLFHEPVEFVELATEATGPLLARVGQLRTIRP